MFPECRQGVPKLSETSPRRAEGVGDLYRETNGRSWIVTAVGNVGRSSVWLDSCREASRQ